MALDTADRDTVIGAGVILIGAALLVLAYYGVGGRASTAGYNLTAAFNKADGIGLGSDVRLSGVSIGRVVAQSLDDRFRAVVTMRLPPSIELPDDSAAVIQTDGLLGAKYISLQPGADEDNLKPGQQIRYTQDSMNVQDLLELIIAQGEAKRNDATPPPGSGKAAGQ